MFTRFVRTGLLVPLAAAAVLAAPLKAQIFERHDVEVRHGDLDLTNDAGVAALDRRIRRAAVQACGRTDPRDLQRGQIAQECRNKAIAAARPAVEVAVARARSGDRLAQSSVTVKAAE